MIDFMIDGNNIVLLKLTPSPFSSFRNIEDLQNFGAWLQAMETMTL